MLLANDAHFTERYQCSPFRSGAWADGFGNPPAMPIRAMTRTPAHPPPMKAVNANQKVSIVPFLSGNNRSCRPPYAAEKRPTISQRPKRL
jgi:hypothetical protein